MWIAGSGAGGEPAGSGPGDAEPAHPQSAAAACGPLRPALAHAPAAPPGPFASSGTPLLPSHHRFHAHGESPLRHVQKLTTIINKKIHSFIVFIV